jgi:hypothetical protein
MGPSPLAFDLPTLAPSPSNTPNSNPVPLSISVQTNAQDLDNQYTEGHQQLGLLAQLLDRIELVGCVDCWLEEKADLSPLPHKHPRRPHFDLKCSSLKSLRFPPIKSWPFCYLCWVPFRSPCYHPPLKKNGVAAPDLCPHGDFLPTLLMLIWLDPIKRCQVVQHLNEDDSMLSIQAHFFKWLRRPPLSPREVANPHRFLIAYYQLRLESSSPSCP